MYKSHFGLNENPFSISPDPRYLYMSQRHREALAHLLYGTQQAGGFIQLTGEVGTGKTTLTRALLQQIPDNVDIALLLNPKQSAIEFLQSICDELRIDYRGQLSSIKTFVDALNDYLLEAHQKGRHTVLLIDEAQNLTVDVLEQIRLLTNLETTQKKLLQIILVGQPELRVLLARKDLRQLAQRITARYHLLPLTEAESREFIMHRLNVAGQNKLFFNNSAIRCIHSLSKGIPRLINIICDRALLGAYSQGKHYIDAKIIKRASEEVNGKADVQEISSNNWFKPAIAASLAMLTVTSLFFVWSDPVDSIMNLSNRQQALPGEKLPEQINNSQNSAGRYVERKTESRAEEMKLTAESQQDAGLVKVIAELHSEKVLGAEKTEDITVPVRDQEDKLTGLSTLFNDSNIKTDKTSAYTELFSLWSRDYHQIDAKSACDKAKKSGLACWHNKGTWNNLRLINRPAVITLIDEQNNQHNVVVTSLDKKNVNLSFAGEQFSFPITNVDPYWYGSFVVLWRQPPVNMETIYPGIRGSAALWLKLTLNKLDGIESAENIDNLFDHKLETRVKKFQRDRFLDEDGVVGTQTMIHLNTALNDPGIPLLSGKPKNTTMLPVNQAFKVIQ